LSSATHHLYQEDLYRIPARVLVIIPRQWHSILDEEKALLAKILGSVRISIDSVTLVVQEKVNLEALAVFNPEKVLIFGSPLNVELRQYENAVLNGVAVIKADDLGSLDDNRKKSLWLALKQMFGV
jgi:hypothetical protein